MQKIGTEDIFKPTTGNDSLQEISNYNGVRLVPFATYKNLTAESTMFPHRNIHEFTWTSPDGKTHKQIDHIVIDRRLHSSILMSDRSGQQVVILTTIWWWQKLGRDWQ
jgi:hypothetical protein